MNIKNSPIIPNCQRLGDHTKAILEILCRYKIPNLNIDELINIITNDVKIFTYINIDDKIKSQAKGKDCAADIMKSLVCDSQEPITYRGFEGMLSYIKILLDKKYITLDDCTGEKNIDYDMLAKDIQNGNF